MRTAAFVALAAYLTISEVRGTSAADVQDHKASSYPSFAHGVGNEQMQQHIEEAESKRPARGFRAPWVLTLLAAGLGAGLLLLVKSVLSHTRSGKKASQGEWEVLEEAKTGGDQRGGEAEEEEPSDVWQTAEGFEGADQMALKGDDYEFWEGRMKDLLKGKAPPDGLWPFEPPYSPVTIGVEETLSRIDRMQRLAQWVREGFESGTVTDSAGGVLGHRVREARAVQQQNKNVQFDSSVPEELAEKFRDCVGLLEKIIEFFVVYYRWVYICRVHLLLWRGQLKVPLSTYC